MPETTTNRRDLITILLACLAGLTVGGGAAAVAPVEDDADLDPDDDPEVGFYQGLVCGEVGLHNVDGTTTWHQRSLSIRFHHYASGLGIVEVVPFGLRNDEREWRNFPLDQLASSSLWDAVFTQIDWQ